MGKRFLYPFLLMGFLASAQQKAKEKGNLPDVVPESSGLLLVEGNYITHNDSGHGPILYELDSTSLNVNRTVKLLNAENVDWEALTQDADYIYVGDFGNNYGKRKDLAIYKITKDDFRNSDEVNAEKITFEYPDQDDFSGRDRSDWDAEAFFVLDNQLIVLSKQWKNLGSNVYAIPNEKGHHVSKLLESYKVNGLITDVTFDNETKTLHAVGYTPFIMPFVLRIPNVTIEGIFTESLTRTNLEIGLAQVEGVCYLAKEHIVFSCEALVNKQRNIDSPARLFLYNNK